MTDDPLPAAPTPPALPSAELPEARVRRSRWIGTVWALPLAALLIVAFLGIRALSDRGIDVVVTFPTGGGARVDDTKVVYQGIEAGRVTKIVLNADGHSVDMTLKIIPRSDLGLTTTTQFWLIGANPSLSDIASLRAALAGVTIGVAPGNAGTPTRRFVGLTEPPIVAAGTAGSAYNLTTSAIGNLSIGSLIFYHGQQIGRLISASFVGIDAFRLGIFVQAPYDRLIVPAALFWISSPVQVSLAGEGARATLEHAGSLLNGAIEVDFVAPADAGVPPLPAGTTFPLYQSRRDAELGPPGPGIPYTLHFGAAAGDLALGAPVRLLGFPVGRVQGVRLEVDAASGRATTTVDAVLFPNRLRVTRPPKPAGPVDGWQRPTDELVERLLATGHRATLTQSPPLIGARSISIDRVRDSAAPLAAVRLGPGRLIASDESGGDLEQITGRVNQLLAKLNRVPLEAIGADAHRITTQLAGILGSSELKGSLQHLNRTLAGADQLLADVTPQVGPLVTKLNATADELNATAAAARGVLSGEGARGDASVPQAVRELAEAARSIRVLADYLGRHPESLLRGRGANEAEPLPASAEGRR